MTATNFSAERPPRGPISGDIFGRVMVQMNQRPDWASPEDTDWMLAYHCEEHPMIVADKSTRLAKLLGLSALHGIWAGAMYHDVLQDCTIEPVEGPPLLDQIRKYKSGEVELICGYAAFDHLIELGVDEQTAAVARDCARATTYEFDSNGVLVHPQIVDAVNPRAALVVATMDVLHILTIKDRKAILDQTLRFFLEKYPDLTEFVRKPGSVLAPETHQELVSLLKVYCQDENRFMGNQCRQFIQESLEVGLTIDEITAIEGELNLRLFNDVHRFEDWESWLSSPELLAGRLHTALPHELKITENNPSCATRPSRRRIRLPFGIFS